MEILLLIIDIIALALIISLRISFNEQSLIDGIIKKERDFQKRFIEEQLARLLVAEEQIKNLEKQKKEIEVKNFSNIQKINKLEDERIINIQRISELEISSKDDEQIKKAVFDYLVKRSEQKFRDKKQGKRKKEEVQSFADTVKPLIDIIKPGLIISKDFDQQLESAVRRMNG